MVETYVDSSGSVLRVNRNSESVRYFNSKDQLHRLDGPAVEYTNGYKSWWLNDQYHRLDGPAIERADGSKYWFVKGKKIEPLFLVAYWLERGRCCWFDEEANELRFGDG